MRKLLCTLAMFSSALCAADVTGTWSGPMEMKRGDETRQDSAYLVLKQEGNTVTGTIGPNEEKRLEITKGTADGDAIYIEAAIPDRDAKMVLRLKVDGDKLVGELKAEGGPHEMSGKMTLSKVK